MWQLDISFNAWYLLHVAGEYLSFQTQLFLLATPADQAGSPRRHGCSFLLRHLPSSAEPFSAGQSIYLLPVRDIIAPSVHLLDSFRTSRIFIELF